MLIKKHPATISATKDLNLNKNSIKTKKTNKQSNETIPNKFQPNLEAIKDLPTGTVIVFHPSEKVGYEISLITKNPIVHLGIVSHFDEKYGPWVSEMDKDEISPGIRERPLIDVVNNSSAPVFALKLTGKGAQYMKTHLNSFNETLREIQDKETTYSVSKLIGKMPLLMLRNLITGKQFDGYRLDQLHFKKADVPIQDNNKSMICSEFVAEVFKAAGILPEKTKTSHLTPDYLIQWLQDNDFADKKMIPLNKRLLDIKA